MTGDIFVLGPIGTDAGCVSLKSVRDQIEFNKDSKELTLHIASPGGEVFEGQNIFNALKNTGKKITTVIEGTCASIATLVAAAGSHIIMNRQAQFMIHNPKVENLSGVADSKKLRNVAAQLDQIKTLLIDVYDKKTTLGKEKLWELYDNETWLTADQAQKMGFVDETKDAIKAVASINLQKISNEMEQTKVQGILTKISNFFSALKITNEAREALADGTIVLIMTEDGDFVGKQVTTEDGTPLPAGEHALASGKTLVVGPDSTITEVKEAVVDNTEAQNDMKKDEEIANLKAQLAEAQAKATTAEAAQATASKELATAKAEQTKMVNKVTGLEKEFLTLKETLNLTVGDTKEPAKGPVFKAAQSQAELNPLDQELINIRKSRHNAD